MRLCCFPDLDSDEGIAELGFSLACEGRRIIMPSLPGYGNSDDPSLEYYATDNFENEAEVLWQYIHAIGLNQSQRVHFVGHSMGSEIISVLAVKYPGIVSSLTLLNPAGAREAEHACSLMKRFISSGLRTATEFSLKFAFSWERDYEEALKHSIPGSKSPFALSRIPQRLSETKRLLKGRLLENIKNTNCPIIYISGSLDTVYPPGKTANDLSLSDRIMRVAVGDPSRFYRSVIAGLHHNTTLAPDEITAANITHYLEKVEGGRAV